MIDDTTETTETETTEAQEEVPEVVANNDEKVEVVANDDEKVEVEHDAAADHAADPAALRKEAAGYRRKLRDAETERDALSGRVEALQRAEAERIAAAAVEGFRPLADGADLWRDGAEVASLLAEDGSVDGERVREVVVEVAAAHPGWRVHSFGSADAGRGAGAISSRDPDADFADALQRVSRG